jgi:hypothetical protein
LAGTTGDQFGGKAERLEGYGRMATPAPDPDNAGEGRFASQVLLAPAWPSGMAALA